MNPDHARQVQVWDVINSYWNKEPFQIRGTLTETSVRVSDRRAVFVGVDAYEAAGGTMLHDLFQGDDGGWLEDPALLDRLVTEKIQAETETTADEGWKWIEVALDLPCGDCPVIRHQGRMMKVRDGSRTSCMRILQSMMLIAQGAFAAVSGWQLSET